VGEKVTNLENPSNTAKMATFLRFDLVNGPMKSINTLSIGKGIGDAECNPTAVF
jgi:hypothetical protein